MRQPLDGIVRQETKDVTLAGEFQMLEVVECSVSIPSNSEWVFSSDRAGHPMYSMQLAGNSLVARLCGNLGRSVLPFELLSQT